MVIILLMAAPHFGGFFAHFRPLKRLVWQTLALVGDGRGAIKRLKN
jgi:hypothetical protein